MKYIFGCVVTCFELSPLSLAADSARTPAKPEQASRRASDTTDKCLIAGKWRSESLEIANFSEWKGVKQIELVGTSARTLELFLIMSDGKRVHAPDTEGSIVTAKTVFLGPVGSGLLFSYRFSGESLILELLSETVSIRAKMRRQ